MDANCGTNVTHFTKRMSPRLHPNQNPHPELSPEPSAAFRRRISPRQHKDNGASVSVSDSDTHNDFGVCLKSVTDIQRRLSPRLHPNTPITITITTPSEDASKQSVFQRRLSPRFHPHQPNHTLNLNSTPTPTPTPPLNRFSHDFHSTTAKRNKLHHPDPKIHPTTTTTDAFTNPIPPNHASPTAKHLHPMVKATLRIYNTYYLHFLQEEEERRKQQQFEKAKAETSKSKEEKREKQKSTKIVKEKKSIFRADLKALTKMIKNKETLNRGTIIGPVPGIDVGDQFYSRAEMVAVGLHKHWLNGIAYVGNSKSEKMKFKKYTLPIALSVVMSGQYEDDLDNSEEIIYTGQGGHDLVGSKLRHRDEELVRGNLALKNSMDQSVLVRVIRSHDNPDSYSGKIYSYDGLYKVVETLSNRGLRGHLVYRYLLKRLPGQPKLTTEQVEFVRGLPPKTSELPGLICRDISNGQEDICIPVTNIYDNPPVGPAGFTYITTTEVRESVKLPPIGTGCTCKGGCTNPSMCACAKLNGSDFPYVRHRGGRLIEPKDVVFECGPNCGCGHECLNRTSQRGIKYRLEVYRTSDKGWAVRTRDFIPSGAPVCEYIGVLSRSDELDNVAENDYIFEIDCLHTINEIDGRERRFGNLPVAATKVLPKIDERTLNGTPEFSIDAGSRGNVARFINHSCEPNLFVQCILSAHHDFRLARVVLFAADNISPMQELVYDYGYALDSVVGPDGKVQVLPCFCGTAECRKRLY